MVEAISLELSREMKRRGFLGVPFISPLCWKTAMHTDVKQDKSYASFQEQNLWAGQSSNSHLDHHAPGAVGYMVCLHCSGSHFLLPQSSSWRWDPGREEAGVQILRWWDFCFIFAALFLNVFTLTLIDYVKLSTHLLSISDNQHNLCSCWHI